MAEASQIVSPILKAVIGKLGSRLWNEVELLWSVEDDFEQLQEISSTVADVLDDAERRSISSRALSNWLRRLKDVTFDVDDVVDEFHTEALRQRLRSDNCITRKVCDFFSANNPIVFYFKMAHKIKDVRQRFNDIAQLRRDFHLTEGSSSAQIERIIDRRTYSYVNESKIYGRNADGEKIIHFLLNVDNDKDVSVLPIVGLGGVGKTTLAQLVYNDQRVKENFELQMWVCVSVDFNVQHIAKSIIEHITKNECRLPNLQDNQEILRSQLSNKRFILVLDDVWSKDPEKWEKLKTLLVSGKPGNKIMVTTRMKEVAEIVGTVAAPYQLGGLSNNDCWSLFKERAFGLRMEGSSKLKEIGEEIVKRCGGLPLVAKTLGSLMATKREEVEWLAIQNSEIWRLPEGEDKILSTLKLSYDYLPPHLKHCFAYCSLFRKDSRIDRLKLIQLWIAEGFIPMLDEGIFAEDVGNQYFNSLLWGSFFQEEERDQFGDIVSCKMHDLMHDLACSVARNESCIIEVGKERSVDLRRCRYVSVASTMDDEIPLTSIKFVCQAAKLLRSLFLSDMSGEYGRKSTIEKSGVCSIPNLMYLHALDLSGSNVEEVPNAIGKLKHLRFLDLSETRIKVLPSSITRLYNLQTLKLRDCEELMELPEDTRNMSSLRHLDIDKYGKLTRMPGGLGRLRSLQTLPLFIVGEEPGCSIMELQHLNLLRGNLSIRNLKNVKDPIEAMEARLSMKTNLQRLELCWENDLEASATPQLQQSQSRVNVNVDILENLQPPANIRSLKIENYSGNRVARWLTNIDPSSFSCLQELSLVGLKKCESLGSLGQLQSLKSLWINGMDGVKSIGRELYYRGDEGSAFSSLTYLKLEEMPNLEEWVVPPERAAAFPCLEELYLRGCPKLVVVQPHLPSSIVKLRILNCSEEVLAAAAAAAAAGGGSLQGLSRLRKLEIWNMEASKSEWEGLQHLTALQELEVYNCKNLTCLPEGIMMLPCLQSLALYGNDRLESLISGRRGGRGEVENENESPPLFSNTIHCLSIYNNPSLTALPEWLGCLTSLQSLYLLHCPKLEILPNGMKHLTSLQQLLIQGCPILEGRCERERGEDWHKIAHIPTVDVVSDRED